jgi:PAS domain S-box-containing protein
MASMGELRILLVEDNPDDAALIGHGVATAPDPWSLEVVDRFQDALVRLAVGPPLDGMLLDLGLPDSAGPGAIAHLRVVAPDLPLVVLTGGTGSDDVAAGVEALKQGADDYLLKGSRLTIGALQRAVRHAVGRRLAARRLEESEARYRHLVETATDIIYRTNPHGYFSYVNPVAVRIMGYPEAELLGKHFTELIRADMREGVRARYEVPWEGLAAANYEFVAVTRDGRELWIEQQVQPVLEGGRLAGFQAVARDVSERKAHELERERLIADLQQALAQVRTLTDLLPVCASCRRIRDDGDGSWAHLERYLAKNNVATRVTHGICPDCRAALYPKYPGGRPPGPKP